MAETLEMTLRWTLLPRLELRSSEDPRLPVLPCDVDVKSNESSSSWSTMFPNKIKISYKHLLLFSFNSISSL